MPYPLDITGERYGRLIGLRRIGSIFRDSLWEFRCDCGSLVEVMLCKVRQGHTKSCGCLQRETTGDRVRKHMQSNGGGDRQATRPYRIWQQMKARCYNPQHNRYERYGGRGIRVCPEWLSDFSAFERWALAHGYDDRLTIDRIDNDAHYHPSNCQWSTYKEQAQNRGGKFAKSRLALQGVTA